MSNIIIVKKKINDYRKKIIVSGDKSISIRWVLFASLAKGVSMAKNILKSEDVLATIDAVRKLGIKVILKKNFCKIYGNGLEGYVYKKNITINAQNSGTLSRLLPGFLVNCTHPIKIIGDKSLSRRDFKRILVPLNKFGANIKLKNNKNLPLIINGTSNLNPIKFYEKKGSAQCKSAVIFAGLRTKGTTIVKAKKSRNHTELLFQNLKLPIKIKKNKKFDLINIQKVKKIQKLKYNIPSDISSSAFFIILTVLSDKSNILIKNVNINPSRVGVITILKKMGANITYKNIKFYKGEKNADIQVKGSKFLKSINCPISLNSSAIDEFLLIFLVAAKAKGVSTFKKLDELNKKESPRLNIAINFLKMIGIKVIRNNDNIKIFGNSNLTLNKSYHIKKFDKDHRVFMMSVIAALTLGGRWSIEDKESIKTSFPKFIEIVKNLGGKII